MNKYIFFFFFLLNFEANAQINSPESKLGVGELSRNIGTINLSNGAGATNNRENAVNIYNPASYGFLKFTNFDASFTFDVRNLKTSEGTKNFSKASFNHFILGLPATKRFAFTIAYFPYSVVNYKSSEIISVGTDSLFYQKAGTGGLNKGLLGASFKLVNDSNWKINIGYNLQGLFGKIERLEQIQLIQSGTGFRDVATINTNYYRGLQHQVGFQVNRSFRKKHNFTLGAAYEFSSTLLSTQDVLANTFITSNGQTLILDTSIYLNIENQKNKMPSSYRIGLAYGFKNSNIEPNNFQLSVDYAFTNWSKSNIIGNSEATYNTRQLSFGANYIKSYKPGSSYLGMMNYSIRYTRAQTMFSNSFNDNQLGVVIGLPIKRSWSIINVGYTFGNTKLLNSQSQQYHLLHLNLLLNDLWFIKYKID